MSGHNSAYAVLGLRPGAGRAEVDQAYRRLIKRFHPDRMGGDCSRAAEINRAYTQIRRQSGQPVRPRRAVPLPVPRRSRRRRAGWLLASALAIAGAVAVANDAPRLGSSRPAFADPLDWPGLGSRPTGSGAVSVLADLEQPLETAVIDRAIADALRFHGEGHLEASVEYSRACHNSLREDPSLIWFDSCAAFDEATVTLQGADLFAGSGPFNPASVTARNLGAARLLSHDMLAADSRLHQIRSRVELALLPRLDEAAGRQP